MAKKKNNRRQQAHPVSTPPKSENNAVQAAAPAQSVEEATPVTIEDVAASANQAEFEANKEKLLQQVLDEIGEYDEIKKASEAAAEIAKAALDDLESKKKALEAQRDALQQKLDALQQDFDNDSKKVLEA